MTTWTKYTLVCESTCDALIEYTFQAGYTPNNVTEITCLCGSQTVLVSVEDATIQPTTTKEENMEAEVQTIVLDWIENDQTVTRTYTESDIRAMVWNNKNLNEKQNETFRKESQLRSLLQEVYADSEDQETLARIAEIFDIPLTKEVEVTIWVRVDATIEVDMAMGDFDSIESYVHDNITVDSYGSEMCINNYDVDRVEEGAY